MRLRKPKGAKVDRSDPFEDDEPELECDEDMALWGDFDEAVKPLENPPQS